MKLFSALASDDPGGTSHVMDSAMFRGGGRPKWRVLGRPPAKILKERKDVDVARAFGKKDKPRRKTNLGSGLTYDEAKDYWLGWAHRSSRICSFFFLLPLPEVNLKGSRRPPDYSSNLCPSKTFAI